jgi:ATP-binding cassette, subfamily A (ABC1), member 5
VLEFEKKKVITDGLRILNIQKTYNHLPFGWKSKKDVHAVRGVYLEVPDKELLCLLGHNGAGKSTLFNMLTGIVAPSSGNAKICGYDIRT